MAGIGAGADWQTWTSGHIVQIAAKVGGRWLQLPMAAAAVISILLGLQTTLLSGARLPFAMAEDGFFHPSLAQLHARFGTPVQGILLSTTLCAFLGVFRVPQLIAVYMWLRVATSVLTLLSVWRLRYTQPARKGGFRIPGGAAGLAVVVLIPCCLFAWALINGERWTFLAGPAYLALGPLSYAVLPRSSASKQYASAD
jgi:APA family basic amino acid/polyamine antiporter